MTNMDPLFAFEIGGCRIACVGLLIDCVETCSLPSCPDHPGWEVLLKFITQRSHNTLGKWPVHVFPTRSESSGTIPFCGFRVYAKCCSLRSGDPSTLEYGILVWHEMGIEIKVHPPVVQNFNWTAFAEPIEI